MAETDWTLGDLAAIKAAIAKGVLRVQYQDKLVTYRSLEEMLQIKRIIEEELGVKQRGGRRLAQSSKGLC